MAVALIDALAQYLYVHAPLTVLIPVPLLSVNTYVVLSYQHAYVVFVALAVVALVAAVDPGVQTLVIFKLLGVLGAVHKFANVKLVPLGMI